MVTMNKTFIWKLWEITERHDKIKAIYEKIANKELSFGCKIKTESNNKRYSSVWRISSDERDYYIDIRVSEWQEYLTSPREWNEIISDEGVLWYSRKIIWHPVMIWDVLDWMEEKFEDQVKIKMDAMWTVKKNMYKFREKESDILINTLIQNDRIRHNCNLKHFEILLDEWKHKRKPIEEQSDECIDYIYNLLWLWDQ